MKSLTIQNFLMLAILFLGLGMLTTSCEQDPCEDVTCLNGGSCEDGDCVCPDRYTGEECETDKCETVGCKNGSYVINSGGSCECDCDTGYEGDSCNIQMRTKFLGNYDANDDCVSSNYSVTISKSSQGVDKIIIEEFGQYGCNGEFPNIIATVDGQDLTINEQTFCSGDEFTVSGTGSINDSGTSITINYNGDCPASDNSCQTYSCSATLTPQ